MKQLFTLALAVLLSSAGAMALPRSAGAPVKLIDSPTTLMAPVWSPDGTRIAATGDSYTGIFVISADGKSINAVSDAPGAGYRMAWTDNNTITGNERSAIDGRTFYTRCTYNTTTGLRTVAAKASRKQAATSAARGIYTAMVETPTATGVEALSVFNGEIIINPALSPDGKSIAFQVPGKGMWLINSDGTGLRALGAGSHPAWMPDSRTILYTVVEDNGATFTASSLRAMDLATGETAVVSDSRSTGVIALSPAISPDGKKVAFENAQDNAIYILKLK